MQEYKFSYDKENDDLFIYDPRSKSKGSIELGNFIIDLNAKKDIVALQITNASRIVKEATNQEGDFKEFLSHLVQSQVSIKKEKNVVFINIHLLSSIRGKEEEIHYSLISPEITETSPALVY